MDTEIVFLDFDGVVADTFQLTYNMHKILRPTLSVELYRQFFTDPDQTMPVLESPAEILNYNNAYEVKILSQTIFPGASETIRLLSGIFTVIFYSISPRPAVEKYLSHHDLIHYGKNLITEESPRRIMSDIIKYLRQENLALTDALIVSDTLGDLRAARDPSLHAFAAAWGYHPEMTLALASPTAMLDSMDSLPGALEEHFDFSSEYQFS